MNGRSGPITRLLAVAAVIAAVSSCGFREPPPEIISQTEDQVSIVTGLEYSPKPLAKAHCAKYGKRPFLRNTVAGANNAFQGWAQGTKTFVHTFDCM